MGLKDSVKRAAVVLAILAIVFVAAVAQETRSEVSVQGTWFFTKDTEGNGVRDHATNTDGFLIGYRYNITRWLAVEAL